MIYHLTIRGRPVSWKNSKRVFGGGRIVRSAAALRWEKVAKVQLLHQWAGKRALEGELAIAVIAYCKGRLLDVDNALGGPFDLLTRSLVICDDAQLRPALVDCAKDNANPRTEIWLAPREDFVPLAQTWEAELRKPEVH